MDWRIAESSSNAIGTAALRAQFVRLFGAICGLAPELAPPSDSNSVSLTINPTLALDRSLDPAYSNCPETLALILSYIWCNIYTPLFYLALVKHCVDGSTSTMKMVVPRLAEGSRLFRNGSAADPAELPGKIREGLGLLRKGLKDRENELQVELISVQKWKSSWNAASSALSIVLVAINLMAFTAATVPPAAIVKVPLAFVAAVNLLGAAMKAGDPWLGMKADERKSKLASQADAIKEMRRGSSSTLLVLSDLEQIRELVENLKIERAAVIEQNTTGTHDQARGSVDHATAAAAAPHLEQEVEERKKKIKKWIKRIRKMVGNVEREVKKKAITLLPNE